MFDAKTTEALRGLPSVHELADRLGIEEPSVTPAASVVAARAVLRQRRREILANENGAEDLATRASEFLRPRMRRVLNGTGVILHTNLGRAPLPAMAIEHILETASGYADVELDAKTGTRASRAAHVRDLLAELTGAEDALVVNNGAAAVLLAVTALADGDRSVIVSRGQLVEIGGGFRIPDVITQSGARLIEVGTTNRTRLSDYADALARNPDAVVLRVHPSNFRTTGFVQSVPIEELVNLDALVIDDVGSGALLPLDVFGDEPVVRASVEAGADVVCFSGDKLLGGPQVGILVGRHEAIAACARHPLARALRIGRLPLAALTATLTLYADPARALCEIPTLAMLNVSLATLHDRAERLARASGGTIITANGAVGGGALPLVELPGPAVTLSAAAGSAERLSGALRAMTPPLLSRVVDDTVVVNPRTLSDADTTEASQLLATLFGHGSTAPVEHSI